LRSIAILPQVLDISRFAAQHGGLCGQSLSLHEDLEMAEKAYAQVQEIAVRAIEGSASTKQLANLQQLFSDQVRKSSSPER
jgi:hypothetical protein